MTLDEAFAAFKNIYGSHSAAARALGINTSYYRDIRNGRVKPGKRMQEILLIKAGCPETLPHGRQRNESAFADADAGA